MDDEGKARVTVTAQQMTNAINRALADAAAAGGDTEAAVELQMGTLGDAATTEFIIPEESLGELVSGGIKSLTVSSPVAAITFDQETLAGLKTRAT